MGHALIPQPLPETKLSPQTPPKKFYIPVKAKFALASTMALSWFIISCWLSYPWVLELAGRIGHLAAWLIVLFIALVPGYLNIFLMASLLLDRPPRLRLDRQDYPPLAILIAAYNEERNISETLRSIRQQDYPAAIQVIIVDDGSTDGTRKVILDNGLPNLKLIAGEHGGKSKALNLGLAEVTHELVVTIDADTFLHPQALRRIVVRMLGDPSHTAAVAGSVLAKNSRDTFMTRLQEWDYFLAIASVKRQQALYQGTLVAQGAFSLYKTELLRSINGWPACIGEDIVLTWALIKAGYRIGFEPTAVGFTRVPVTFKQFARQRRRWARGMIEGFKYHWDMLLRRPRLVTYLLSLDLLFPVLDLTYTLVFIPGIFLAFLGHYWIVGPMTLAVLPLTLLIQWVMYRYQRRVFSELGLKIRRNRLGFIAYSLIYQLMMSPVCVWGYAEEILGFTKKW